MQNKRTIDQLDNFIKAATEHRDKIIKSGCALKSFSYCQSGTLSFKMVNRAGNEMEVEVETGSGRLDDDDSFPCICVECNKRPKSAYHSQYCCRFLNSKLRRASDCKIYDNFQGEFHMSCLSKLCSEDKNFKPPIDVMRESYYFNEERTIDGHEYLSRDEVLVLEEQHYKVFGELLLLHYPKDTKIDGRWLLNYVLAKEDRQEVGGMSGFLVDNGYPADVEENINGYPFFISMMFKGLNPFEIIKAHPNFDYAPYIKEVFDRISRDQLMIKQ